MKEKLVRGAAWIAATRATVSLIGFFSTILLARLLVPEDFGLVAIAITVMAIVASVTEIPLSSALMQHQDPSDEHYHTAFTMSLIRGFGVTVITAALAWPISVVYDDARLFDLILVLSVMSGLAGLSNPKLVVLWRSLFFWQEFLLGVSQKLLAFIAAAAIAVIYQSYWALVIGSIAGQLSSLALSYTLVRYRPRFSLAKMRELLSFSIWLTLSQLLATVSYRFDNLFIGYFLGKTRLGYYGYGDNLAGMATREVTAPVANTLFAAFARLQNEPDRLRAAHDKAQSLLISLALPVGCGLAAVAHPLVFLALGEKWGPAVFVIEVISVCLAFQSLGATFYPLALALGQTRSVVVRDVWNLAVRLPVLGAGFFLGGFAGVVLARLVEGAFALVLSMTLIKRLCGAGLREQLVSNIRPFVAVGAMVLVVKGWQILMPTPHVWFGGFMHLTAQISLGAMTYVVALLGCWFLAGKPQGLEQEGLWLVRNLWRRASRVKA